MKNVKTTKANRLWTAHDQNKMLDLVRAGLSAVEISEKLGRSAKAITQKVSVCKSSGLAVDLPQLAQNPKSAQTEMPIGKPKQKKPNSAPLVAAKIAANSLRLSPAPKNDVISVHVPRKPALVLCVAVLCAIAFYAGFIA